MTPRTSALAVLVAAIVASCGGPAPLPTTPPGGPVEPPTPMRSQLTTVAVLGTLHESHLGGGYPLAVVEHVVRAFEPDVVLVELPPGGVSAAVAEVDAGGPHPDPGDFETPWIGRMPELYEVVIPLRHELGYAVEGISGWTTQAEADRDAYYLLNPHGPVQRQYLVASAALHAAYLEHGGPANVLWLHGPEFLELSTGASFWLAYYAEDAMRSGGELHLQARHAALLNDALDAHRGERVLVVFDVAARWALEPTIDVRGDVYRVDAAAFLP